jgi:hypothetical protein
MRQIVRLGEFTARSYIAPRFPGNHVLLALILITAVPAHAADSSEDLLHQIAPKILAELRSHEGWKTPRCMIGATVARNVVTAGGRSSLEYGDEIVKVNGIQLTDDPGASFIATLRQLPPSGAVRLTILRKGAQQTESVPCADSFPSESLIDTALVSATSGDFAACTDSLDRAASLHQFNWLLARVQFECRTRAVKSAADAPALYALDRQAIHESALAEDSLKPLSGLIGADARTLREEGAPALEAQLQSELEAAQSRVKRVAATAETQIPEQVQTRSMKEALGATYEFRTLRVGGLTTPTDVEAAMRKDMSNPYFKCGLGADGMQVCNGLTVLAGSVAEVNSVIDASGRLIRVMLRIRPDDFDRVTRAAKEKYGAPASSSSAPLQNAAGATFINQTLTWGSERGNYIKASKYADTIDKGFVYFGTPEDTALLSKADAERTKKGGF